MSNVICLVTRSRLQRARDFQELSRWHYHCADLYRDLEWYTAAVNHQESAHDMAQLARLAMDIEDIDDVA